MICTQCGTENSASSSACIKCASPLPFRPPGLGVSTSGKIPDGSSAAGTAAPSQPIDFGPRYRVERLLGEGGMGAVYLAYDLELDRHVALKLVRPELLSNPEALQRFKQELLLASRISHRNILRIHDLGEHKGLRFVSMSFVEGEDLHKILSREGKLPLERTLNIARQLCSALEAAHAERIVHRDLKPQNVLMDSSDHVYILDFGLAKSVGETDVTGITMCGDVVGTPRYMAPEQVEGKTVDHRADIYATGLILYETITGNVPFQSDSTVQLMYKHVHEQPRSPKALNPEIPDWFARVILKCLEKDPDLRYQSAASLLNDIDTATAPKRSLIQRAAASIATPRPSGTKRKRRWPFAVAGLILVLAVLGIFLRQKFAPAYPAGKLVSVLVADFDNKTGDAIFDGTLEPVFNTALESASFINAYRRGAAHQVAAKLHPGGPMDSATARLVAVREGISVVVSGGIVRDNAGYRITAQAIDAASGKTIVAREVTVASRDAVLAAVGKLAAPIRSKLGDSTPESAQLAAEETFTTDSLDAAHSYSIAQELFESGKSEQAIQHYQKAVDSDPNMGRAYAGLAVASVNLKKQNDAEKYYRKTLSLLDRMSEREKYRTLGTYFAAFVHNYPEAIQNYERLTFLFPGDTAGWNNLSIAYVFTLDFQKAIAAIKHAIELSPDNLKFHLNYALYSMYAGNFPTAIDQAQYIIQRNPSYEFAYLPLGLSTLARGDANSAQGVYSKLEKVGPETFSLAKIGEADLELYLGHATAALQALAAGLAQDEKDKQTGELALKYVAAGEAQLAKGQRKEAVDSARKAAQLDPGEESVLYPAARLLIAAGEDEQARQIANTLNKTLQTQSRSYAELINGEIALEHKQLSDAVLTFQNAQKVHNTWISHFLLGRAYYEAGHFGEALAEFETCKARQGETADLMFADTATLRYLPPLYYWMAKAQQGMGTSDAAKQNFQQYIHLRDTSDYPDPLLQDARRDVGSAQ
jgi:tetratricopeptide (TPR) repeat protein